MAGHIRGNIECFVAPNMGQFSVSWAPSYMMVNLYNFFLNHSNCTMIASNYGHADNTNGFVIGTAFTYPSTSGGLGNNSWFLTRMNATSLRPFDIYHLFQFCGTDGGGAYSPYSSSATFGLTPGNPGVVQGSSAAINVIAHACAVGIGGTGGSTLSVSNGYGNPWKGTSNNNGADTKGSTVWGTPSGGTSAYIWPRSNDGFGSFSALAQNMTPVTPQYGSQNSTRFHILADDDSWVIASNAADNGDFVISSCGIYTPSTYLSSTNLVNVYQFGSNNGGTPQYGSVVLTDKTVYGTVAGTSIQEGGVGTPNGVRGLQFDGLPIWLGSGTSNASSLVMPNLQNSGYYDENDFPIGSYEISTGNDWSGLLGKIDFIRMTFGIATESVKTDYSRLYVGATRGAQSSGGWKNTQVSIPWDNVYFTIPRSGYTPQGVNFISTNP